MTQKGHFEIDWPLGQKFIKFLRWFFGKFKTSKSHSENNWPLILIINIGALYHNSERKPFWHICSQKISVFNNNWKFGLPTKVAPLFMKKNTPKTIKKRHRNHTLFFPRAEWHRMDFDQDRINFLHFAQDRNLYLAYLVLEVLTPPPPPGPTCWAYLG